MSAPVSRLAHSVPRYIPAVSPQTPRPEDGSEATVCSNRRLALIRKARSEPEVLVQTARTVSKSITTSRLNDSQTTLRKRLLFEPSFRMCSFRFIGSNPAIYDTTAKTGILLDRSQPACTDGGGVFASPVISVINSFGNDSDSCNSKDCARKIVTIGLCRSKTQANK